MKLSLSNTVFSKHSLTKNLATIKKLGFENIEFNMRTDQPGNEKLAFKIKKMLIKQRLNCLTLHAATFPVTDEIEIPKAVYFGKVSANFAKILSAPTMVIHSNVSRTVTKKKRKKFLFIIFNQIQSHAKNLGINLSLENLSDPSKSYGKDIDEIEQILNIFDDQTIGLTLDFCHYKQQGKL